MDKTEMDKTTDFMLVVKTFLREDDGGIVKFGKVIKATMTPEEIEKLASEIRNQN